MCPNQFPFVEERILKAVWLHPDASDEMPFRVGCHYSFKGWQHPVYLFIFPRFFRKQFLLRTKLVDLKTF